jgi:hypothetical protein
MKLSITKKNSNLHIRDFRKVSMSKELHSKNLPTILVLGLLFFLFGTGAIFAQRIIVENATLKVGGKPIFLCGGNTPWNNWNDFGGNYNSAWWDAEFARIKAAGGNCTRVWVTCSGEVGINIDANGMVSGATAQHWANLDDYFALAQKNKIYVLATLISFDHTKNTYTTYQRWRNMYTSQSNVNSFVTNYVTPFVNRYKTNPYLFAVEPCNEIEWVNQDAANAQLPWTTLQYFVARVVAAVHAAGNKTVLTTVGCNMKWQTDLYAGAEGNQFSDTRLRAQYNDANTYLDVYSPHFYDWVTDWFGNPLNTTACSAYGLADKPVIIGEMPAVGVGGIGITPAFENCLRNGVQGILPWTTNGVDNNGSLSTGLGAALTSFKNNHTALVYPDTGTVLLGDANADKVVNINDALLIARYAAGLPATLYTDAADVNKDGLVSITDALLVARYVAGLITGF